MRKLRKIAAIALCTLLAATLSVGMVGCKDKGPQIKVNPDKEHYVVGICQLVQHGALDQATQGFRDALAAALTAAGRTVEFKENNAQGDANTCATIVNGFVSSDVDLIMGNATAALQAAYNATETIPVLGTSITEYGVALGLTDFDGTVGGNVSGTSDLAPLDTQAQMLLDLVPTANTIGILYCSAEPNSKYQADVVKAYLEGKGKTCQVYTFVDSNDIASVTQGAATNCDALYVPTDNTAASNTGVIDSICRPAGVPVFAGEENTCRGCGFATLAISYYNIGVKTGEMAAKILLGEASISEMPIAYDANPVKKYNEEICEELGIVIPAGYEKITAE